MHSASRYAARTVQPQPWSRRDTLAILAIVVGAFALRLAFIFSVNVIPVSDFGWYYSHAVQIAHGAGYIEHGRPTAFWPPGWPYFLAFVVRIFGAEPLGAQIVQAVLNSLTAGVVFLIARVLAGSLCATIAAAAYALLPSGIEWSATLASEPLFTLLWAAVTYIWLRYSTAHVGWYALSGVLLGFTSLVRPSALLLCGVLALYLLCVPEERRNALRATRAVLLTALCMVVVIAPTLVRNYRVFGTFVLISNNGGVSLYQGNNPAAGPGYSELTDPTIARLMSDPRTEVQADRLAEERALAYIRAHPVHVLTLSLRKIAALYRRDDLAIRFTFRSGHFREAYSPPPTDRVASIFAVVNNVAYGTLMAFAVFGFFIALTPRMRAQYPGWMLLAGMIVYNTAMYALVFGIDRYRFPTMPFFAAFAGLGAAAVIAYMRVPTPLQTSAHKPPHRTHAR